MRMMIVLRGVGVDAAVFIDNLPKHMVLDMVVKGMAMEKGMELV